MEDWASRAAARDLELQDREHLHLRKEERDSQIKDKHGIEMFQRLNQWMRDQIDSYNRKLREKRYSVSLVKEPDFNRKSEREFSVIRTDGGKQPLKLTYDPTVHRLRCESSAGHQEYVLAVGEDGQPRFESLYHQVKTIEEIGTELLESWEAAHF